MNNLKPCFSAYIFFGIVGLIGGTIFTILVMIVDVFVSSYIGDIYYVTVWIIGLIATVIYLSYYRIEIKKDEIVIPNSLFDHRKTTVNICDLDTHLLFWIMGISGLIVIDIVFWFGLMK